MEEPAVETAASRLRIPLRGMIDFTKEATMRSATPFVVVLAFLLTAPAGTAESGTDTLTGEFESGYGDGELEAEFTATGRDTWNVAFHFRFDGQRHVYRGTAKGSLTAGRLEGAVQTEGGQRRFSFEGVFERGRFRGTHYEVKRGRSQRTGTLTLRR